MIDLSIRSAAVVPAERLNVIAGGVSVAVSLIGYWFDTPALLPLVLYCEWWLSMLYLVDAMLYFEVWRRKTGKVRAMYGCFVIWCRMWKVSVDFVSCPPGFASMQQVCLVNVKS